MNETLLTGLGLGEHEVAVYLALLHNGSLTVAAIAKHSKVKRSTVYLALDALGQKGLIKQAIIGKRHYYLPENPEVIRNIYQKKLTEIEAKLPSLHQIYRKSSCEPEVATFYGKEHIRKIYQDVQASALYAKTIFSPRSFLTVFSKSESLALSEHFARRDASLQSLLPHDTASKKLVADLKEYKRKNRLLPKDYDLAVNTLIWGNKVALISYENLFGLVITNAQIATSFEHQFDFLWQRSTKA